jgi:uncharacterized membrane protein
MARRPAEGRSQPAGSDRDKLDSRYQRSPSRQDTPPSHFVPARSLPRPMPPRESLPPEPIRAPDQRSRHQHQALRPGSGPRHRRLGAVNQEAPTEAPSRVAALASVALAVVANILALTSIRLAFLGPAIGFWFLVLHPAYLIYTCSLLRGSRGAERVGYSLTAILLVLMVGGLAVNTILPVIGVARPLSTAPVVVMADLLNLTCYLVRRRWPDMVSWRSQIAALGQHEVRLLVIAAISVVLAVLGANRLNNDAGGQVSLIAQVAILVAVLLMLYWHRRLSDAVISMTIYLISLALLFMTSLRGWYVTGHDIQTEYRVFQLTAAGGRWNISDFHDAYNACLSLTILPTEIARLVDVYDPYVYKVFFQLMFALCPVLLYCIARRYGPKLVCGLAVVYFVGFPDFVNDMPFLNRQEIAFLFVCVGLLAVTNSQWPQSKRRFVLYAAGLGVELSHYATMYLFLGLLVVSWVLGTVMRRAGRWLSAIRARRDKHSSVDDQPRMAAPSRVVGAGSVLILALTLILWGGLATQTAGPALKTVVTALGQFGHSNAAGSYSIFARTSLSPQELLAGYRKTSLKANASSPSVYLPTSTVARYPTPLVNQPDLPLTSLGHLLSRLRVPVEALNADVREGAAKDEQLFVLVGFAAFLFTRRLRARVSHELLYMCAGSIFMVGLFTLFPNLSVDYGTERAFQEALILAAPILVVGSLATFSPFGRRWSLRIASVACVAIFASTIGLMPQVLGGYPPQLNLNDSGQYYDIYYSHPQDEAAASWLAHEPHLVSAGVQTPLGTSNNDIFPFIPTSDVSHGLPVSDIYPTLIKRFSWVLLNYAVVHTGRAPLSDAGVILSYRYPTQLLQSNKNLVYNNGSDEIYK